MLPDAIRHPANPFQPEGLLYLGHHRQQGLDIGLIAGLKLAAQRPVFFGQDRAHDHLALARPMVLGKAQLTQAFPAPALKIEACSAKKAGDTP
jgi:hypothetical protein